MTRPASYINWVPSGNPSYITQPPAGQSNVGWQYREAPPFQYMNWLFYTLDQWVQWFDTAISYGSLISLDVGLSDYTVPVGYQLWSPYLTIQSGATWTVPSGAMLTGAGPLTADGTLIALGTVVFP